MSCSRFARRYWGNPCWFLFLRLLICLSSAGNLARSEVVVREGRIFKVLRPWSHGPRTASFPLAGRSRGRLEFGMDLGVDSRYEFAPEGRSQRKLLHLIPRRRTGPREGAPRSQETVLEGADSRSPVPPSFEGGQGFLGTTLRRACSREDPRAPDAFEDCVIRRILRFARHIAFRRALHRRGNRGIRRRK